MTFLKTENFEIDTDENGVALMKIDVPNRSVNVITRQFFDDFNNALDRIAEESSIRLLVIRSMKPSGFFAGADIQTFAEIASVDEAITMSKRGQDLFNKLELLPIPVIAIIHGVCLGGGLELALACDYRLVIDGPKTQIGLPEIRLGLLPGWGGTQRLPRVVGLERSMRMILASQMLNAREAKKWGLADSLARTEVEQRQQIHQWMDIARKKGKVFRRGLPHYTMRQWLLETNSIGRSILFKGSKKILESRTPEDMPAPFEAFEAIRVGVTKGPEEGYQYEREAAGQLALSPACHNLVSLFLEREKARKSDGEKAPIQNVGVVGTGTMGAGIAQLAALKEHVTAVQEVNAEALGRGVLQINQLFQKAMAKGVISPQDYAKKIDLIKGTLSWEGFAETDLVIEAAVEQLDAKRGLFHLMEQNSKPTTILATNTSSLSVSAMAESVSHPERVAGLHFFNPVHKMELVEVIQSPQTSEQTIRTLMQWARDLGKTPVLVKDSPGFLVNRILMPYVNEAVILVHEGMGIDEVDRIMKRFGMLMGPLEMVDQVGLDIAAHVAESMKPMFGDRAAPSVAFERMRSGSWLGQKSGAGFYRYSKGKKSGVNRDALPMLQQGSPSDGISQLPPKEQAQQARDRMVLLMVNEAAMCLQEQIVSDPQTVDLAMILGTGWAPHRGGPLHYADTRGLQDVVSTLNDLAKQGRHFEPCDELKRRAEANEPFFTDQRPTA